MNPSSSPVPIEAFPDLADLARTLGHAHRLTLLSHAAEGEQPVERLAELCGLSVANTSQHLQHLKRAGMVLTRREGKHVLYRLGDGPITGIIDALHDYLQFRHAEIRAVVSDSLRQRDRLQAVALDELLQRMQMDDTIVLDVRPPAEFAQGHLPGAVNIPLEALEGELGALPPDKDIVAYCGGQYCVLSANAVTALRASGREARRFEAGFTGWQQAGLRVEAGT
ncbi:MAG: metalloregulator ArsR/SmtB family transcription factor [Delftia acidovorans]|nr:metalloregulator ArsR/SmtB family transcription factor [Delftia acidovorans]